MIKNKKTKIWSRKYLVGAFIFVFLISSLFYNVLPVQAAATIVFRSAAQTVGGTAGTIVINKPTGTVQYDVLVASIAFRPNTLTVTPPSGWTLINRQDNANTTANSLATYWHAAGASEGASYTFTFGGTSTGSAGGIATFSGADNTSPVNVSGGTTTGATIVTAVDAPSITTTVGNTMLVTAHAFSDANTWAPPSGMTEAVDVASVATPNDVGESESVNYVLQASAGATGIKTANAEGVITADVGEGIALALEPAGSVNETFSSTSTWVAPQEVTSIVAECWGGGGAGGAAITANLTAGGGGAGGAYSRKVVSVTPGNSYTVTVGAGGVGGAGAGPAGGDSWFSTTGTIIAKGGAGGALANSGSTNGAGGTGTTIGSIGDTVYAGGNGAAGIFTSGTPGGAGGGGAGSSGAGGNATTGTGGTGTTLGGGSGANGVANNTAGATGSVYGGGGSGGKRTSNPPTNRNGGSGAAGKCVINYFPTFTMQYYTDSGLTVPVADNARLDAGTYYVKITSNKTLDSAPTVTIDAEGTANDVTNVATTLVSGNNYKYTRVIASDALAIGSILENWSVTGIVGGITYSNQDPTNEATKAIYTDTVAPTVSTVAIQTLTTINVTFSEGMGTGVTTAANYTISESGQGTLAANPNTVALVSGNTYVLTWSSGTMIDAADVTITVVNAQDLAGNTITTPNSGRGQIRGIIHFGAKVNEFLSGIKQYFHFH